MRRASPDFSCRRARSKLSARAGIAPQGRTRRSGRHDPPTLQQRGAAHRTALLGRLPVASARARRPARRARATPASTRTRSTCARSPTTPPPSASGSPAPPRSASTAATSSTPATSRSQLACRDLPPPRRPHLPRARPRRPARRPASRDAPPKEPRHDACASATTRRRSTCPRPTGRSDGVALETNPPATVVVFTCNHCPYALAWHDRIAAVAARLRRARRRSS